MKSKLSSIIRSSSVLMFGMLLITLVFGVSVSAETKSDYDREFDLSRIKTYQFSNRNAARDVGGQNSIWEQRVRTALRDEFSQAGFVESNRNGADFFVTFNLSTDEKVERRYVETGYPGHWRRWGRWYWYRPGWRNTTVFDVPYTESRLVMNLIDAKTGRLIWRGYDTETMDYGKAEKKIKETVDELTDRLKKDIKDSAKRFRLG